MSNLVDCDILFPMVSKLLQNDFVALAYLVEGHLKETNI
jgi:hypothetical protein